MSTLAVEDSTVLWSTSPFSSSVPGTEVKFHSPLISGADTCKELYIE